MPLKPDYDKQFEILIGILIAVVSMMWGFFVGFSAALGNYTLMIMTITMIVVYCTLQAILHIFAPDIYVPDK